MLPLPLKVLRKKIMEDVNEQKIEQPTLDAQQLYLALINNDAEEVEILRTKKKYKIRWLKNGQLEKLTRLLLHKKTLDENTSTGSDVMDAILEDSKLACKAAAIIILDGYWKLKFRYWYLWRWSTTSGSTTISNLTRSSKWVKKKFRRCSSSELSCH